MAIQADLNTRAGSGFINLSYEPSGIPAFPNTSAEISDISIIEIDLDLDEDSDNSENVFFAASNFKAKFFDKLGNGGSLLDEIKNIGTGGTAQLALNFTTDGGYNFIELYTFQKTDIKYDREERSVEIEAKINIDSTLTISDIFDANTGAWEPRNTATLEDPVLKASDFIQFYATEAFPNANFENTTNGFSTFTEFDGNEGYLIEDASRSITTPSPFAHQEIYKIAAIDGSVVGLVLGWFFIINRRGLTNIAVISEDDVEDLNIEIGLESYHLVQSTFIEFTEPTLIDEEHVLLNKQTPENSNLNPNGVKSLSIFFGSWHIKRAFWDETNMRFDRNLPYYTFQTLSSDHHEGDKILSVFSTTGLNVGDKIIFRVIKTESRNVYPRDIHEITNIDSGNLEITIDPPLRRFLPADGLASDLVVPAADNTEAVPVLENALEGYKEAYGATGDDIVMFTVFDIDTFDPHQTIQFDSSFPAGLANIFYRPTKLTYNIFEDKIEIQAYNIE